MQCSGSFQPGTAISQCSRPRLSSAWWEMSMFSDLQDRVAAHDRVAVVPVPVVRVHAVGGVPPSCARNSCCARLGPGEVAARVPAGARPAPPAGTRRPAASALQALADLVHHQAAVERREPLVDVVGDDGEGRVGSGSSWRAWRAGAASFSGSISIAWRLLQENTSSAASRQGSHRKRRCSSRGERHVEAPGQPQAEDVLGVVGDARRVAVPPDGVDLVDVADVPVGERVTRRVDARLLAHLARPPSARGSRRDPGFP